MATEKENLFRKEIQEEIAAHIDSFDVTVSSDGNVLMLVRYDERTDSYFRLSVTFKIKNRG